MTTRRRRKWGSGPSAPALIAWVGGTGISADPVAGSAWLGGPPGVASSSHGRVPLAGRVRGIAAGTLLACGSVLAVSVHAADSSSELPDSAHSGSVTVGPGVVSGGYAATPLAVAALSAAAPAVTSDQVFAGTVAGTGTVHRNRPITVGVAGEPAPKEGLPVPLALPGSEAGQHPDSGPIEDAVAPSAPAPSAGADAVGHLAAPAGQVADPVSSFIGQAASTALDGIVARGPNRR